MKLGTASVAQLEVLGSVHGSSLCQLDSSLSVSGALAGRLRIIAPIMYERQGARAVQAESSESDRGGAL